MFQFLHNVGLFFATFVNRNKKNLQAQNELSGGNGDCVRGRFADPIVYLTEH